MSRSPSVGLTDARKPISKPLRKSTEEVITGVKDKNGVAKSPVPSIFRRHSNLSLNASCSSHTSMDSINSRASTGRMRRASPASSRKKQLGASIPRTGVPSGIPGPLSDGLQDKKRCAWITANTDPSYVSFHDEEWGVPAHEDKKLFELLVLSGALAELSWPSILSKRNIFREVFADFDPIAVAKLNEKKIVLPGNPASSLLSELKLRAIIENARQVSKVIDEFGSFNKYIWSLVNHKPIVSSFRYPRQVPVKTPKADMISKDLMRRGFSSVGPTVVYSFMQVAGITNDHLMSCYRFHDCNADEAMDVSGVKDKAHEEKVKAEREIFRGIDELSLSSECLKSAI